MNKQMLLVGCLVASVLLPLLAHGEVYQWVDEKDQVHFGNVPPRQQGPYKLGGYERGSSNLAPTVNVQPSVPAHAPQSVPPATSTTKSQMGSIVTPEEAVDTAASAVSPDPDSVEPKLSSKPESKTETELQLKAKAVSQPKELEVLIKRLRTAAEASRPLPTVSPVELNSQQSAPQKQETAQPPKPVENTVLPAVPAKKKDKKKDKKKVEKKVEVKDKEKPDSVVTEVDQPTDISTSESTDEKNADKCGVFTDFVTAYELKVKDGCPGSHCSVYKRNLKKYKLKKERYCQK